jgi:hypothetical protein
MKSLFIAGLGAAVLVVSATAYSTESPQGSAGDAPWQVGRCYRVFPSAPDKFHTFKVLERQSGAWVRVEPSPASSVPVPGGRPQAPLWINTDSPFAVQEWSCD